MSGEAKNVYLDSELIEYVDKQREKEGRGFSNYISLLIREDRLRQVARKKRVKK